MSEEGKEKREGRKQKEKKRKKEEEEGKREKRKGKDGSGNYAWRHCVTTEQGLPHVYGNYTIVLAELTQLVAPGKPELQQRKEKL